MLIRDSGGTLGLFGTGLLIVAGTAHWRLRVCPNGVKGSGV
ncbi:MAG: hypothetical protein WAM47_20370 [Candidatus Sulfotelmatobacter sp.]